MTTIGRTESLLAIIPARGGSKRLVGKNIKELFTKPLVAWTIEAALKSKYVGRVVVSTDDQEISDISKKYGAEVPFLRPRELSEDGSSSLSVVRHAIESLDETFDAVVLLQPTSPLRTEFHIDQAFELMEKNHANAVISVCEVDHPVEWTNTLPKDGNMRGFIAEEHRNKRSQDLEKRYRLNGAIYLVKTNLVFTDAGFMPEEGTYAYIMDRESSVDIDDMVDFKMAESLAMARVQS